MNEDQYRYLQLWMAKAEEDLLVVRQLMEAEMVVRGAVGFHCQQAAEKFLKGFLLYSGVEIIKTHNIEFLLHQCNSHDPDFSILDPGNLTDFGVEARYPGDFLEPSLKEMGQMISVVEQIREMVLHKINRNKDS